MLTFVWCNNKINRQEIKSPGTKIKSHGNSPSVYSPCKLFCNHQELTFCAWSDFQGVISGVYGISYLYGTHTHVNVLKHILNTVF